MEYEGKINTWGSVPLPPYEALKTAHSQIKNTAIASWQGKHLITVGEKNYLCEGCMPVRNILLYLNFL